MKIKNPNTTAIHHSLKLLSAVAIIGTMSHLSSAETFVDSIPINATTAGETVTVTLADDTTLIAGSPLPKATGEPANYVINTNNHVLDLSRVHSRWVLNKIGTGNALWTFTGGGTVSAWQFHFASGGVGVDVDSGVTLRATGGSIGGTEDSVRNLLRSRAGTTISADSTFAYAGGDGMKAGLESNRDIGALVIESGTLMIFDNERASVFKARGGIRIDAGASLVSSSQGAFNRVTADRYTFGVNGNRVGFLDTRGDVFDLSNIAIVVLIDSFVPDQVYNLFSDSVSNGGALSSVNVNYAGVETTLVRKGSSLLWEGSTGNVQFGFDAGDGTFVVHNIPEASSLMQVGVLLAGGLAVSLLRRRTK